MILLIIFLGLIKQRFEVGNYRKIHRDNRGWPVYWYHESEDKLEVIKMMRWFAGNEIRWFGQLLAPVVNRCGLQGPFKPSWWENETPPKLVVIDGDPHGHDSNMTSGMPMEVTKPI